MDSNGILYMNVHDVLMLNYYELHRSFVCLGMFGIIKGTREGNGRNVSLTRQGVYNISSWWRIEVSSKGIDQYVVNSLQVLRKRQMVGSGCFMIFHDFFMIVHVFLMIVHVFFNDVS